MSAHWARIRKPRSAPLSYVLRTNTTDAAVAGTYATKPREMDKLITEAWQTVYSGQGEGAAAQAERAQAFLRKYEQHVHTQPQRVLEAITAVDVQLACKATKHTAGGPDGWAPDDWAILPSDAYSLIATLLNEIEKTRQMAHTIAEGQSSVPGKGPR